MRPELTLIVREADITDGRREGYPECCIWWFAFVWSPVCLWLMTSGYGDGESLRHAKRLLRGTTQANYVQCPRCRAKGSTIT